MLGQTMKYNKKYFLAVFTALGLQFIFGINLVNAKQCEAEIRVQCKNWFAVKRQEYGYDRCVKEKEHWTSSPEEAYKIFDKDNINITQELQRNEDNLKDYIKRNVNGANDEGIADSKFYICMSKLALGYNVTSALNSNSSNNQTSQVTSSNSTESSQQNSTPEDVERNNVRSYSAQQTAAYQQKYKGRGKKHNVDAYVNQCIKTKGRKVLNTCDFDIEVNFCAENPDPSSKHFFEMASGFDCAKDSIGMWGIKARGALMGVFTADSVSVFACKKPFYPFAEYDHQKKTLVGRCGEL